MQGLTDEQILSEAVRLVNEGMAVTLPVKGRSMLPFILGGHESVVLTQPGTVRKGDVVLARIGGSRYVLHRVLEVSPDSVVLMGDGNIRGQETCPPREVLARADEVVGADGRHRRLDAPMRRFAASLWRLLRPVRRYLLFIYRKLFLRNIQIQ